MQRLFYILGFLGLTLLSCYFFDRVFTPNPTSRLLPVVTYVQDGDWKVDRFQGWSTDKATINGHDYLDKAPFSTWLVIPFYSLYWKWIGEPRLTYPSYVAYGLGNVICGALPLVFLMAAIFTVLRRRRSKNAVWLAVLPVFSSYLIVYSGTWTGHLLAGALLLGAWIEIRDLSSNPMRRCLTAGLLCGAVCLTEYQVGLFSFAFLAQILWTTRSLRRGVEFCAAHIPAIAVLAIYNYTLTGSPLTFTYHFVSDPMFAHMKHAYGFGLPSWEGLFGLALGLKRGVFLYAPILIYLLRQLGVSARRAKKLDWPFVVAGGIAFYILIASYQMWWGGWAYGSRHLIPLVYLIFFEGVLLIDREGISKILYPLCAIGFLLGWLINSTVTYMIPEMYANPIVEFVWPKLVVGQFNNNNLMSLLFAVSAGIGCLLWPAFVAIFLFGMHFWYNRRLL